MKPRSALAIAVTGLALQLALAAGLLASAPEGIRLALAFAALVLLPGHAWLSATGARPPGGAMFGSGWALGFGVAWVGLLVLLTRVAGVPFTTLTWWSAPLNALVWVLPARRGGDVQADSPRVAPLALFVVLTAAALAMVHCARLGTPVSYYTDSPDHIGTIRRMLASGDAFPLDAFFKDAGAQGADPRKGLWHPVVALIARLADVDPLPAWQQLAALLAPLFVINAAAFGFLLAGSTGAAMGGAALLLTYGSSLGAQYLREAVFATKLADQLALATTVAVLADVARPSRGGRLAAIGLALGTVAAHVFGAIQFGLVFGALGVGILVRDRSLSGEFRRLAATAAALGGACLPYLVWRASQAYAPGNVIHIEPQGLLTLWDGMFVVSPGVLWDWTGSLWLVFPLSWWAWAKASRQTAVLALLTTSLTVFLLIFNPFLVVPLQPKLGYLLMRMVWLLPVAPAIAWGLPALVRAVRSGSGGQRGLAGLGLICAALLALAPMGDAIAVLGRPGDVVEQDRRVSVRRWSDALAWMDRELPAGSVILSDPATSYSVPMMTRHYVATLVDQHSSPNDTLALERIFDARDALDPHGTWQRTREVIARYGVTAIALNNRFSEWPSLDYWAPEPVWFAGIRARLDRAPGAFVRRYDSGDFVVYEVDARGLDTLRDVPAVRPFVRPWNAAVDPAPRAKDPAMPGVIACDILTRVATPGDTVWAVAEWRTPRPQPKGSYNVLVRVDGREPAGFAPPAWLEKPARKLLEHARKERYRFRVDHLPAGGDYGVDLWSPGEVVRDSFPIVVPGDMAAGDYQVQLRMRREPHYANHRLSDYFLDEDYYTGVPVGTLRLERPRGSRKE